MLMNFVFVIQYTASCNIVIDPSWIGTELARRPNGDLLFRENLQPSDCTDFLHMALPVKSKPEYCRVWRPVAKYCNGFLLNCFPQQICLKYVIEEVRGRTDMVCTLFIRFTSTRSAEIVWCWDTTAYLITETGNVWWWDTTAYLVTETRNVWWCDTTAYLVTETENVWCWDTTAYLVTDTKKVRCWDSRAYLVTETRNARCWDVLAYLLVWTRSLWWSDYVA